MGAQNSSPNQKERRKGEDRDLAALSNDFKLQKAEIEQKIKEINGDQAQERRDLQKKWKLLHLNMCLMDSNKKLKEINELVKQERIELILTCEKSYVQKEQEVLKLTLLHQRAFQNRLLRRLGILEEGKQAEQQSNAAVGETSIETEVEQEADKNALQSVKNELVAVRENIRCLEEQEATISKQLDAINTMLGSTGSKDEDTAIATSSTCDTLSLSVEMPTVEPVDERGKEMKALMREVDAVYINFQTLQADMKRTERTCEETLKREKENHEVKLRNLKEETCKGKKTLKEMGEIMKKETANLVRALRTHELTRDRGRAMAQLQRYRGAKKLYGSEIDFIEAVEIFYREKYGGGNEEDESELQKLLVFAREEKEAMQKELLVVLENIRVLEEQEMSTSKELDAINKEIGDNIEASTSISLSASVTDNPPAASRSSSAFPPSERQIVLSGDGEMDTETLFLDEIFLREQAALREDRAHFEKEKADAEQKISAFDDTLKREKENHEVKLRELKEETYKSRRTLKEMGEIMKKETANLVRALRKKELEITLETKMVHLLLLRRMKSLYERNVVLVDSRRDFCRSEDHSNEEDEKEHQEFLLECQKQKADIEKELLVAWEKIRVVEEEVLSMSKELDAINKEVDDNDEGAATATTSMVDPDSIEAPTEYGPSSITLSTSVTDNPPAVPPSSSATPPSQRQKVVSHNEEEDRKRRLKLSVKEIELMQKQEVFHDDLDAHEGEEVDDMKQKVRELKETLKRERMNHELKLVQLKTEISTREIWKREAAKLERIFRKKELEINRESKMIELSHHRKAENLSVRELSLNEECLVFYREKDDGKGEDEKEHQEYLRKEIKYGQKDLLAMQEKIRVVEEEVLSMSKELDAINKELDDNDEGAATATTSMVDPDSIEAPTEYGPSSISLSTSVTDNPPAVPPSSSATPPSQRQKVISGDVEGGMEWRQELSLKEGELMRKRDALTGEHSLFEDQRADMKQKISELEDTLKHERMNHELKLVQLKTEISTREIWKREAAKLGRIFRKKELELGQEKTILQLLCHQNAVNLLLQNIGYLEEYEVLYGEKYSENETSLQRALSFPRAKKEKCQKDLAEVRREIRFFEGREIAIKKELDAINNEMAIDNVEDPSLSTSVTDNPPSAPSSSSESPPSEHRRSIPGIEDEANGRIELTQEEIDLLVREFGPLGELKHKEIALNRDWDIYCDRQKVELGREADIIKFEQLSYDVKLIELKAEVFKRKKSLKELGIIWKLEEANLGRILRKKVLENREKAIVARLSLFQQAEILYTREIGLHEEFEVYHRERHAGEGNEVSLDDALRSGTEKEKIQQKLQQLREDVRGLEEEKISLGEELLVVTKEIEDNIEALTSISLSASVTDYPPAAPPSSSESPLSERQKIISRILEKGVTEEEREAAAKVMEEIGEKVDAFKEYTRGADADLKKRDDVIASTRRKMEDILEQLSDMGALKVVNGINELRTDLTADELSSAKPLETKYFKCKKLKDSLNLEYKKKNAELEIEIAEFYTTVDKADETRLLREVDILESALKEECDATYRRHYEQHLLKLNQELAKLQQEIAKSADRHARFKQQLLDLEREDEGPGLLPAPPPGVPLPPPPPVEKDPFTRLLEDATAREEKAKAEAGTTAGTAASPEEKVVKNNDARRRSAPIPPSTEDQQIEDIDDDPIDAAAASSTAASRKKKNNKKKSAKSDAQPQTSTDEPSKESISAEIDRSDQPGEAKVIASTSDSNEATALPQLSDGATTTAVIHATATREDDGILPIDVASVALPTVDVENAENTTVEVKGEGKKAKQSPVVAAHRPVKTPSKPPSTSTNPPKPTSTSTPTTPKPTTPKPSPAPAASATPQPLALVPLEKRTIKPRAGGSIISAHDFCVACRELEQAKAKGREIVSYFPRGFVNTGNACYRNSVLQSLLASPPLIRLLSALSDNAGRMPKSMPVWREVLAMSGELTNEPLPQLYMKKSPSVAPSTSSGQAGKAPDQSASVKPQALAAASQGAATIGLSSSNVGGGKSLSGTSSGGGTGAMNVLGGDTLTPDAYFLKTFYEFRRKMARLRGEAPLPEVSGPESGSSTVERPRIPKEDAMEFMTYLLESLNEEIAGWDEESEKAAAEKEAKQNSGWESVSTTKTKTKVQNVIDDTSRMNSAKGNAATTVTRLFYGTLRSVVCYPANKSSANKKINSATFQPFSNLNLNITEPMELTGPYSLRNFKREGATALVASSTVSTLSNEPLQQCLLPPLTLGRALEGYFQSTPLDEGAYKTIQFEHLPQVLVLQLDRFSYDYDLNVPNKIDREIRYPMMLELPTNMLSAELIDQLQEEEHGRNNNININMRSAIKVSYSLVAVVRHHGATATSGHYTALCRDNKRTSSSAPTGSSISSTAASASAMRSTETRTTAAAASKWGWEYDDAKVTAITAEDALQATQTAYILLYCRN